MRNTKGISRCFCFLSSFSSLFPACPSRERRRIFGVRDDSHLVTPGKDTSTHECTSTDVTSGNAYIYIYIYIFLWKTSVAFIGFNRITLFPLFPPPLPPSLSLCSCAHSAFLRHFYSFHHHHPLPFPPPSIMGGGGEEKGKHVIYKSREGSDGGGRDCSET